MHGLKILDLSRNHIEILPNSISTLENLTTLLLGHCSLLKKVPSFSKLQALKKLDLERTNLKDIPHGLEKLVNLKYLDLRCTQIREMADGILTKFTNLQHLATYSIYNMFMRGEEIGELKKLEIFKGRFYALKDLNDYAKALHSHQKRVPRQYRIFMVLGPHMMFRYCLSPIVVDLCEEAALFSWVIPVPLNIFSSLSWIMINSCKNIKKLFSSNCVLQKLQNLSTLEVERCVDMEEIISSEPELEHGTSALKFSFPKLRILRLKNLPKLKSICGANGVMVCDSIQQIEIISCPELKRIPLNLPLQDDGQPSPPPSLRAIYIRPKECQELVEWDHPYAKSLSQPYISEFYSVLDCDSWSYWKDPSKNVVRDSR
ncbi:hypothetical protein PTKIN_Ptkin14bG0112800 [Pterospermum kingtungense]